jgi:hypothetical protein
MVVATLATEQPADDEPDAEGDQQARNGLLLDLAADRLGRARPCAATLS